MAPARERPDIRPRYVVCGDDALAFRIVEELARGYDVALTVVVRSRGRLPGPEMAQLPGVRVVAAERVDASVLRAVGAAEAEAIAVVGREDPANLDTALRAGEVAPGVRLVVRLNNLSLGRQVQAVIPDATVLSDAAIAAPDFVAAALGEVKPSFIRIPGRTLYVSDRAEVPPQDVICGLADTSGDEPDLLPADQARCDRVLVATGPLPGRRSPLPEPWGPRRRRRRWLGARIAEALWRYRPPAGFGFLVTRALLFAAIPMSVILVGGTIGFALVNQKLSILDAIYLAIMTASGGGEADLTISGPQRIVQSAVSLASVAVIPLVIGAIVEPIAKLAVARPRPTVAPVVVVGLGRIGSRALRQLHDLGVPVVGVDRSDSAIGVRVARDLGIPFVHGDATETETLSRAMLATSQALLVVTSDDVTNVQVALHARSVRPDLRLVLRLFDADFADRVRSAFGITVSRSASMIASSAFVTAMLRQAVLGTIPVGRQLLMIVELPVVAGSALDGAAVSDVEKAGEVRLIAVASGDLMIWTPGPGYRLHPDAHVFAVATRAGARRLLGRGGPAG